MTFANGDRFLGQFKANMMHGLGRCYSSGTETLCTFFENKPLD